MVTIRKVSITAFIIAPVMIFPVFLYVIMDTADVRVNITNEIGIKVPK